MYDFVDNNPLGRFDLEGLSYDPMGGSAKELFPISWAQSGNDSKAKNWYSVHCASHCLASGMAKAHLVPSGIWNLVESKWSVGWEIYEKTSSKVFGFGSLDESWADSITDLYANSYGANVLAKGCSGKKECRIANSGLSGLGGGGYGFLASMAAGDAAAAAMIASCCDKGCAKAQDLFEQKAEENQAMLDKLSDKWKNLWDLSNWLPSVPVPYKPVWPPDWSPINPFPLPKF